MKILVFLLRWLARLGSVVSLVLIVLMATDSPRWPNLIEWSFLIFFPIGVLLGMAVSWWKEGLGACVSLASLGLFYLWHYENGVQGIKAWPVGPWFFIFSFPAVLFLASALGRRLMRA